MVGEGEGARVNPNGGEEEEEDNEEWRWGRRGDGRGTRFGARRALRHQRNLFILSSFFLKMKCVRGEPLNYSVL